MSKIRVCNGYKVSLRNISKENALIFSNNFIDYLYHKDNYNNSDKIDFLNNCIGIVLSKKRQANETKKSIRGTIHIDLLEEEYEEDNQDNIDINNNINHHNNGLILRNICYLRSILCEKQYAANRTKQYCNQCANLYREMLNRKEVLLDEYFIPKIEPVEGKKEFLKNKLLELKDKIIVKNNKMNNNISNHSSLLYHPNSLPLNRNSLPDSNQLEEIEFLRSNNSSKMLSNGYNTNV